MVRFPKDLYADVRVETVFSTKILLDDFLLKQNKTKTDTGALVRVFDGTRWYYGATTDLARLQEMVDGLARMATPAPGIDAHPAVARMEANRGDFRRYADDSVARVSNADKLALMESYVPVLREAEGVLKSRLYYLDRHTEKRFLSSRGADLVFDIQQASLSARYTLQGRDAPFQGGEDVFETVIGRLPGRQEKVRGTLRKDLDYCRNALPVPPGTYTCILSPLVTGVFAHESFGHKSEADFMAGDETMAREWAIGRRVGVPELNILDSGAIEGAGYVPFDDEGTRARETWLIRGGLLSGRLHSAATAAQLGEEPTGNARAVTFEYEPIVRMTTTYVGAGTRSRDSLFADVADGLYIDGLNHGSGMTTFTLAPRRAYRIRNGQVAEPVSVSVITGNVMKTLEEIDGISDEVELFSFALGGCGKMEQHPLPVGFGGPTIRVRGMQVQ